MFKYDNVLSPEEKMYIFLESSQELDWTIDGSRFSAINPNNGYKIFIHKKEETTVEFMQIHKSYSYQIALLINPDIESFNHQYAYINTGDYCNKCDRLLQELYRKAQHKAQAKLFDINFGDVPVSTG